MGYFSNGTEGEIYQDRYCSKCHHWPENPDDGGCDVWLAHMLFNYDECNNPKSILHMLIPRKKDGVGNEQCRMFIPRQGGLGAPNSETPNG